MSEELGWCAYRFFAALVFDPHSARVVVAVMIVLFKFLQERLAQIIVRTLFTCVADSVPPPCGRLGSRGPCCEMHQGLEAQWHDELL